MVADPGSQRKKKVKGDVLNHLNSSAEPARPLLSRTHVISFLGPNICGLEEKFVCFYIIFVL